MLYGKNPLRRDTLDSNQKPIDETATDNAIRASFISSLFDNPGSLIVGGLIQGLVALLAFAETKSALYLIYMLATLVCAFWRYSIVLKFHRDKPDLLDAAVASY